MRSDALAEGEFYALKVAGRDECVRVKLVSAEARYTSKVIVAPAHSDDDEAGIEVPVARIESNWTDYVAENVVLVDTMAFWDVAWIPERGEVVELEGTDAIPWTVIDVLLNEDEGSATIRGEVFGQTQERTVPIPQLRPRSNPTVSTDQLDAMFADEGIAPLRWRTDETPTAPAPARVNPVRDIRPETIADRLVLSETACRQYRQIGWCRPGAEESRMRSEVRRKGVLGKMRKRQGFARYVVPGRFEFVLPEDPTTVEGDLWVDEIIDLRTAKAKARFEKESKTREGRRPRKRRRRQPRAEDQRRNRRRRNRRKRPNS
jgi:hypothetical protein